MSFFEAAHRIFISTFVILVHFCRLALPTLLIISLLKLGHNYYKHQLGTPITNSSKTYKWTESSGEWATYAGIAAYFLAISESDLSGASTGEPPGYFKIVVGTSIVILFVPFLPAIYQRVGEPIDLQVGLLPAETEHGLEERSEKLSVDAVRQEI